MAFQRAMTPEELHEKMLAFYEAVDAGTVEIPSDYRLAKFLGISTQTLHNWMHNPDGKDGNKNNKPYYDELKTLKPYREDYYLRRASSDKNSAFAIFCLKQEKNGGYKDKEEKSVEPMKLEVTINGVNKAFE